MENWEVRSENENDIYETFISQSQIYNSTLQNLRQVKLYIHTSCTISNS